MMTHAYGKPCGGLRLLPLLAALLLTGAASSARAAEPLQAKAERLAQDLMIVDSHIDYPERYQVDDDFGKGTTGQFDAPRARKGGLDVAFMAIYVSPDDDGVGNAKAVADERIAIVESLVKRWPQLCAFARTPADIRKNAADGKLSLPMGMENAAPLGDDLQNVGRYYERGIRYITLSHMKNNLVCDASTDRTPKWHGLSPFGRKVVAEMNRLGMMIDVSHVSDQTFEQVLALSKTPIIASHSSCRTFTSPGTFGYKRNLSDDMMKALAAKGGVIQINFGSAFLSDRYVKTGKVADVKDVAAHIHHAVKVAGVDHVGIGSDFDGVGDSVPSGLEDVAAYPNLIRELLTLGYTQTDLQKILGGNLLRVWSEVEKVAQASR